MKSTFTPLKVDPKDYYGMAHNIQRMMLMSEISWHNIIKRANKDLHWGNRKTLQKLINNNGG